MNVCKKLSLLCLLLACLALLAGCAQEQTPYALNDSQGYTVSVKFDANGGTFTTNTSVIVDAFCVADAPREGGKASIALIPPEHEARGHDAFTAVRNGHFLAGWYAQRTGTEGSYTYAQPWDFENDRLTLEPGADYSSAEPVLTLYAVWVPLFQVDFVDLASGESLGSYTFDPQLEQGLQVPTLDEETGAMQMFRFPARKGYTFQGAYYDAAGTQRVDTPVLTHTGTVDPATGTATGSAMTVYLDWLEGEWYHIYNVDQFLENASLDGSYVLHEDLDFTGRIWPTVLMYGNFSGTIQGNGHSIRNVELAQTNNSKANAGLFGRLTETARLENVKLENITFTVQAGTRVAGASFGLLSGAISGEAALTDVTVENSRLLIDATAYFGTEDYVIGLVSGLGGEALDASGIACGISGESDPPIYAVADDRGFVTLTDTPAE